MPKPAESLRQSAVPCKTSVRCVTRNEKGVGGGERERVRTAFHEREKSEFAWRPARLVEQSFRPFNLFSPTFL
jgi:hypothetical protein